MTPQDLERAFNAADKAAQAGDSQAAEDAKFFAQELQKIGALSAAPEPVKESDQPSMLSQIGRQIGLTARYGIEGVGALPGMAGDAVGLNSTKALSDLLTKAGLPKPEGSTENVVGDMTRAIAGGGAGMAAGAKMAAGSGSGLAQRIGAAMAQSPSAQTIANATGSGAAGVTRESGGDGTDQLVAGVAGSMSPIGAVKGLAGAVKGAVRGGEEGRQQMAQRISDATDAGVELPAGMASGTHRTMAADAVLSRAPGAQSRMAANSEQLNEQLGRKVSGVADDLSPNADEFTAGLAIESGIKKFVNNFKSKQESLYGRVDKHIPRNTRVATTSTRDAFNRLMGDISGAPELSEIMRNPKVAKMATAFKKDAKGQGLTYEAIKRLRSEIGAAIADGPLVSDVPNAQLKQLYGALSDDMLTAARKAGPEAEKAMARANQFTKAGHARIDDRLQRLTGKSADDTFKALTSGGRDHSKIAATLRSLPKAERDVVRAAVVNRMGRAKSGRQDAAGEEFSASTFLTSWNDLTPRARRILFADPAVRKDMTKVAEVAGMMRDQANTLPNNSGTQAALANYGAAAAVGTSLAFGRFGAAGVILGGMAASNVTARFMTDPKFVRWLATSTGKPVEAVPVLVNQLAQLGAQQGGAMKDAMLDLSDKIAMQMTPQADAAAPAQPRSDPDAGKVDPLPFVKPETVTVRRFDTKGKPVRNQSMGRDEALTELRSNEADLKKILDRMAQ